MTTTARIMLVITFLVVALGLHLVLCQWSMTWPVGNPVITMEYDDDRMRLFSTQDVTRADAMTFGVAMPVLLTGIAIALFVDTLARRRLKPGQCTRCRYDLRGHDGDTCPECGLVVDGTRPASADHS